MFPDWLDYIDVKRRKNLLRIFEELSIFQDKDPLNFIIIGALPLLFNGYLKYKSYWDIDILFKDEKEMKKFIARPKSDQLRIVDYDDTLMVNRDISSFHTAWTYAHTWFNVDYILHKGFFDFYTGIPTTETTYTTSAYIDNEKFDIRIQLAHPWDIIVDKVFSPRTQRDIALKIDLSIDLRHIFAVYSQEKDNLEFWHYVFKRAALLGGEKSFKQIFLRLLNTRQELGYGHLDVAVNLLDLLRTG